MEKKKIVKPVNDRRAEFESAYFPVDIKTIVNEWDQGAEIGETSRVEALDHVFRWKRGLINGWYGWANDGKGTFYDYLAVVKAKFDGYKFCFMKQEDMGSVRMFDKATEKYKSKLSANPIHNNLMWTYSGKTPYDHYAKKYHIPKLELDELHAAAEWVDSHFIVLYPKDRRYKSVMDIFKFYYEKFGIDVFLIDPFKSLILEDSKRTDKMMDELFIATKEFALATNTSFNFIAHPKSMSDVKQKDGRFKVVDQFMISGGAAWDNNMDGQFSVYRPERHLTPSDPKVHFFNLKQRHAELVGADRGVYEDIKLDRRTRRYLFNQVCPITGVIPESPFDKKYYKGQTIDFSTPKETIDDAKNPEDLPF